MRNNVLKYYMAVVYWCSTFILNAQPGSGSDTGNLETPDTPAAPIDDYIVLLVLVGFFIVFMKLKVSFKNSF